MHVFLYFYILIIYLHTSISILRELCVSLVLTLPLCHSDFFYFSLSLSLFLSLFLSHHFLYFFFTPTGQNR